MHIKMTKSEKMKGIKNVSIIFLQPNHKSKQPDKQLE